MVVVWAAVSGIGCGGERAVIALGGGGEIAGEVCGFVGGRRSRGKLSSI